MNLKNSQSSRYRSQKKKEIETAIYFREKSISVNKKQCQFLNQLLNEILNLVNELIHYK